MAGMAGLEPADVGVKVRCVYHFTTSHYILHNDEDPWLLSTLIIIM